MSKTKGEEKHICRPDLHLAVLSLTVSVNRSKLTAAKASRSSAVKGRIFIFVLFYFFFGGEEEAWRSRFCKKRGAADAGPARVVPPRASQCSGDGAPFSGMGQTAVLRVSVRATDRAHARAVRASRPASIGVRKEKKQPRPSSVERIAGRSLRRE